VLTLVALIVVLGVLVFVHEAGHFVAAKWAGIYVHRFSLGLGSPIPWLTTRRGETEYSISWLPLGGYVKMASREEDASSSALEGGRPEDVVPPDRMFEAKPVWVRMIVILAGVTMNALFAWLLFTFLAVKNGRQIDPVTTVGRVVDELLPPEAASFKQIPPGTRIVRVNGTTVSTWDDITNTIATTPAPEVRLELADGSVITAAIHPDAIEQRAKAAQALQP
jgi:regulator of sigma E protease